MPLPVVPKDLYPLVPQAPGVPAVLRGGAAVLDALTLNKLGIGDALDSFIGDPRPKWGIYDNAGNIAVFCDSVESMSYENNWRVSNYPIEGGKFSSFNKVADPYDVSLRMSTGRAVDNRVDFLVGLENVVNSTDLFTVVTPESTYENANIVSFSYRRTSTDGANKIIADVRIKEVRQVAASEFSNPQQPTDSSVISIGQLQPVDDANFDASGFV